MRSDERVTTGCPSCGKRFAVGAAAVGRRAACKGCGQTFVITVEPAVPAEDPAVDERPEWTPPEPMAMVPPPPPLAPPPPPSWGPPPSTVGTKPRRNTKLIIGTVAVVVAVVAVGAFVAVRVVNRIGAAAGDWPPKVKPGTSAPTLAWSRDPAGRAVGSAAVAMRSDNTQVRLVLPPGTHADRSLPCVFVCPAGSNLLTGVPWGDEEQADYNGLLDRGMAVCFYSLDGTLKDYESATDASMEQAIRAYVRTGSGVGNMQDAIDAVLAGSPAIDPQRLGTIGHSSAGTVAIVGAAVDGRVKAVAAMAPALECDKRLKPVFDLLPRAVVAQARRADPAAIAQLGPDIYIYQADDDDNTTPDGAQAFAAKHGAKVRLTAVTTGGHGGAYTQGRGPSMDFLANALGARRGSGSAATAVEAPPPARPKESRPASWYWAEQRTDGTSVPGAAGFIVVDGLPEGYAAAADDGGAAMAVTRPESDGRKLGVRVLVLPDDRTPRLVAHIAKIADLLLPRSEGRAGIDIANGRVILPSLVPQLLPGMGGGTVAVYRVGDDVDGDQPTREAVLAFRFNGRVVVVHLAVPREDPKRLDALLDSVRGWGLRGPARARATPYHPTMQR